MDIENVLSLRLVLSFFQVKFVPALSVSRADKIASACH